jgi:nicotinate-nucleotide pyrophosphorylase (carboxylating)
VTSNAVIEETASMTASLVARAPGRLAGRDVALCAFRTLDPRVVCTPLESDGAALVRGTRIATVAGPARAILAAERTALNLLSHLSGIATLTAAYVAAVGARRAAVVDTRKTTPGLRALEKYAVRAGGGANHRFGLYDAVLIKDNHVAVAGGIAPAVRAARAGAGHLVKIEIEVDSLAQLEEALAAGADAVLLDNMDPGAVVEAIAVAHVDAPGPILTEVSGGVTLATIGAYAAAGPDRISVGALTHSAPVLDLGLDLLWTTAGTGALQAEWS